MNSVKEFIVGSRLPLDLYKYDYIITNDFECRFSPLIRKTFESNGPKLKWLKTHVPLSVPIASNYPGYDIKFIYSEDPDELIN